MKFIRRQPDAAITPKVASGAAVSSRFFDDYPRFFDTGGTGGTQGRLHLRYEAIFGQHREIFDGARVLDIASHDGRWAFAALKTGASEVVGIEPRADLVENAKASFAEYGIEASRYRLIAGDVFDVLAREKIEVDVVMCLGFMYHTLRYNELMRRIRDINPRHLLVDTEVILRKDALVRLKAEKVESHRNAVADEYSHGNVVVVGRPSLAALRMMVTAYGFELEKVSNWPALVRDNPEFSDGATNYTKGARITERYRSVG
jgi:hypothetical protein